MGRPRKFCFECAPPKGAEKPKPRVRRIGGEPFTVEHFRGWAEGLRVSSGDRFVLEPFQEAFIADVFAGFRECWLIVPEGNGKTTLVALLALYHIRFRQEGWVPVAAATRDQAGLIYRQASGFVTRRGNEELAAQFRCHPGYRRIFCAETQASIQIFAADVRGGDGIIPTLALIDEPHRHKNLELYRTWAGKLDKEDGAQLAAISTAGEPGGEFEELREQFRQTALETERDECFLRAVGAGSVLHEFAVPEDGDFEDLELVKAANPFSGITVESLRRKRERPSWNLSHWRRMTCNLPTRADEAAVTEAEWAAARSDREIPAGEPVWAGLDLGWKMDTTSLVPLWWESSEFRLFGPAVVLEPPRNGNMLPVSLVKQAVAELHERNPIIALVMDMTDGADVAQWASDELGLDVVDRPQGVTYQVEDYAAFMAGLRTGSLFHSGDVGLTRHALNASARLMPRGDSVFARPKESRTSQFQVSRVIDALVAGAMAHGTAVQVMGEEPQVPLVAFA
jgi:phage terminase large subunit-like protein